MNVTTAPVKDALQLTARAGGVNKKVTHHHRRRHIQQVVLVDKVVVVLVHRVEPTEHYLAGHNRLGLNHRRLPPPQREPHAAISIRVVSAKRCWRSCPAVGDQGFEVTCRRSRSWAWWPRRRDSAIKTTRRLVTAHFRRTAEETGQTEGEDRRGGEGGEGDRRSAAPRRLGVVYQRGARGLTSATPVSCRVVVSD